MLDKEIQKVEKACERLTNDIKENSREMFDSFEEWYFTESHEYASARTLRREKGSSLTPVQLQDLRTDKVIIHPPLGTKEIADAVLKNLGIRNIGTYLLLHLAKDAYNLPGEELREMVISYIRTVTDGVVKHPEASVKIDDTLFRDIWTAFRMYVEDPYHFPPDEEEDEYLKYDYDGNEGNLIFWMFGDRDDMREKYVSCKLIKGEKYAKRWAKKEIARRMEEYTD